MRCETLRLLVVAFRGRGGAVAELLMEHAEDDPVLARSLRLALAETDGADRLASEVEKRLRTLQRAKGFIDWDKVRPLARELDGLRETIAGPLAAANPHAAVAQMRRFLELAAGLFERSDDSSGSLGQVFRQAGAELGPLWALLPARDPVMVAGEVLALLDADGYGVTDELLEAASPALGPDGRAELRRLLQARLAALPPVRGRDDFEGWRERFEPSLRLRTLADLEQDVRCVHHRRGSGWRGGDARRRDRRAPDRPWPGWRGAVVAGPGAQSERPRGDTAHRPAHCGARCPREEAGSASVALGGVLSLARCDASPAVSARPAGF